VLTPTFGLVGDYARHTFAGHAQTVSTGVVGRASDAQYTLLPINIECVCSRTHDGVTSDCHYISSVRVRSC
jgi:hypothetical protein